MQRIMLSGKIHTARVTHSELNYEGSLEIDRDLLDAAGILPYEKILVVNRNNGNRFETYAIPGPRGSKRFCVNGPAAHRANVGDVITIMAFAVFDAADLKSFHPIVVVMDENNQIAQRRENDPRLDY
ncbi:MAG: aspartate 1-decarboxylase [Victivallaceae bacterium]